MKHKGIKFEYYDSFSGESLGSADLFYNRYKALNGYYSKWWKKWKLFLSNEYKVKYCFVRVKITLY